MKKLKFADPLVDLILDGTKDTTWRYKDDKNLSPGDLVELLKTDESKFGEAEVIWTKKTTLGSLSTKDKEGHESFATAEEMYETYSNYYNIVANEIP
jgi:hypothetical protein